MTSISMKLQLKQTETPCEGRPPGQDSTTLQECEPDAAKRPALSSEARAPHPCFCSWFLMSLLSLFLKTPNSRMRPRRRQLFTSWKSGNRLYTMKTRTLRDAAGPRQRWECGRSVEARARGGDCPCWHEMNDDTASVLTDGAFFKAMPPIGVQNGADHPASHAASDGTGCGLMRCRPAEAPSVAGYG